MRNVISKNSFMFCINSLGEYPVLTTPTGVEDTADATPAISDGACTKMGAKIVACVRNKLGLCLSKRFGCHSLLASNKTNARKTHLAVSAKLGSVYQERPGGIWPGACPES
jgi:hypothetical protein